ncbi:MAG TPA: endolytic transglycosylase MltG [Candidatus Desulfobacillus sp.]|nr:endolytic transglycosylase MltG [Candidatus Desulfobacillus sp.]
MRRISRLILLLLGAALLLSAVLIQFAVTAVDLPRSPLDFDIRPGSSLASASRQIEEAGVGMPAWRFTLLARLLGKSGQIKAGSYEVARGITPFGLLEKLTRGDVSQAELTLIEGWTFRQFRAALDAHPDLRHDTREWTEERIMAELGATGAAEGRFFPDTYLFARGSADLQILRRAFEQMEQIVQREWEARDEGLPYASPRDALIMASLIEKETGQAGDRAQIASVFVNRLRRGMLLQTDPSVIYGLGLRFDGNLRKRDLLTDGPYNTYTRAGMPPGPIATPGLASIQAALHPARTDLLYFVARGDGSSQFSRTLDEHNRAVARYQLRRGN